MIQDPVVQLAVVVELQSAQGVCDPLDGIGETVCEVVEWIDTPVPTGTVMVRMSNPVEHGITHEHVR